MNKRISRMIHRQINSWRLKTQWIATGCTDCAKHGVYVRSIYLDSNIYTCTYHYYCRNYGNISTIYHTFDEWYRNRATEDSSYSQTVIDAELLLSE